MDQVTLCGLWTGKYIFKDDVFMDYKNKPQKVFSLVFDVFISVSYQLFCVLTLTAGQLLDISARGAENAEPYCKGAKRKTGKRGNDKVCKS